MSTVAAEDRCLALRSNRTIHQESSDRRTVNENRKSNKPLLEKKRRARINRSLDQLKNLLMDVIKNDATTSYSKLEKADILEMTVKHLRQIQTRQMTASASAADPSVVLHRYQTGFNECAQEVNRFLLSIDGLQPEVRLRLMNHLAECITAPSPQPNHSADRTTVRITPPPHFNDMRCVMDRLPVTCSNVMQPLTSQMQLSPVAMEQLRFRDVIGSVTSAYDVMPLLENGCSYGSQPPAKVSRVVAHAQHRRDDLTEGVAETMKSENHVRWGTTDEEQLSLEEAEVLTPQPLPSIVRGKWRPLVERNNNWQNISLNAPTTTISSSSISHPFDDDDAEDHVRRMDLLPVLRSDHFDDDAKEEPVWRPW